MIRFSYLREAYLYQIYRKTSDLSGDFRFQASVDPFPFLSVADCMRAKCLVGLVKRGYLEFRQDQSGCHDGYEMTAEGMEYIEDQFQDHDDVPRLDSPLGRTLAILEQVQQPPHRNGASPTRFDAAGTESQNAVVRIA